MNQELDIMALFPGTVLEVNTSVIENYHTFHWHDRTYYIPKKSLDEGHLGLLEALESTYKTDGQAIIEDTEEDAWRDYFRGKKDIPKSAQFISDIRLLYINVQDNHGQFDEILWRETVFGVQDYILSLLKMNTSQFILVINEEDLNQESIEVLNGIFQALDSDFAITTQLFLGQSQQVRSFNQEQFRLEHSLFQELLDSGKMDTLIGFNQGILSLIAIESKDILNKLSFVKETINKETEYRRLIDKIYHYNGNLSQTAESLYIHRNTLVYRIDKFKQLTGLDLTQYSDLFVAYLLTIER